MAVKGKKPDEYARPFTSQPEPELLKVHDPDKFGCSPCHQGNGRATTSVEKAHGTYEHWLWPLFPRGNVEAGCQTCHAADMVLVTNEVGWTLSDGKIFSASAAAWAVNRTKAMTRNPKSCSPAHSRTSSSRKRKRTILRKRTN